MAITTLAGILSNLIPPVSFFKTNDGSLSPGVALQTCWARGNFPAAGSYDGTLNGVVLSNTSSQVTGSLRYVDPASGNGYIARLQCAVSCFQTSGTITAASLFLADRLWHNGGIGITTTTAQNIVSPTWPARDVAGTTSGDGVMLAVECSGTTGAGGTIAVSYTNSAGVSGRTANLIDVINPSAASNGMYRLGLQTGDTGVQSVQSITLGSSFTSGTINLVAYRDIASLPLKYNGGRTWFADAVQLGFPQIYNGSVLYFYLLPVSVVGINAPLICGSVTFAQG